MSSDEPEGSIPRRRDPLTLEHRRLNMSRIRSRDTKPELIIRRALHARGFRYRLHVRTLLGTPDIACPGRRSAIRVHGCFWHGHNCEGVTPATNTAFWVDKIKRNQERDLAAGIALTARGWRVLTIWECAITGRSRRSLPDVTDITQNWLTGDHDDREIAGDWPKQYAHERRHRENSRAALRLVYIRRALASES